MSGGTISGNTASSGGGVAILTTGTFSLYNGAIKGNRAEYAVAGTGVESGGAVFVFGENYYSTVGRFNMYGGTIGGENSEDANTANIGANAVWSNEGEFTMSGGTITGNAGYGNYGVYIIRYLYSSKVFAMRGTARIEENDKVFLSSGAKITIGGALSASPAANIIHENPVPGTTYLLEATSSGLMTENYQKFLYDGADNRIITFYDGWYAWYGVYN
jgi:hypothetical protein